MFIQVLFLSSTIVPLNLRLSFTVLAVAAALVSILTAQPSLTAIIHKFGVSVDFLRKFRAESVFRCDYKASKLVEPNRDEARAPSGNSSARNCVGAGSQGTVRWDTDGASVMEELLFGIRRCQVHPDATRSFPNPGTDFEQAAAERLLQVVPGSPAQVIPQAQD